jgi:hypothetical protein
MKWPFTLWMSCLGFPALVLVTCANQQDPAGKIAPAESPLEIQTFTVKSVQGVDLTSSVINRSSKDIVAYTIVADFFDSAGTPTARLSANAIMNLASASKGSTGGLAPGASGGTNRFPLPTESNGTPVDYKVSVDYVLFKDGSTWGADTAKQSLAITGTQQGWRQSRMALKRLMAERGIQAVADALAE